MLLDPTDTIVALSSATGPGVRATVRVSGASSWEIVRKVVPTLPPERPTDRSLVADPIRLPGVASPLPADLYYWPAPRTYTGQDLVELHTISSPPLVDLLISTCLNSRARAAQPGEFTMRAFLAGKLDLTKAEAVLGVIEAGDRDELKQALAQLAGGVARPLQTLREDLLNLLADVEAGLDFTDEDIRFVRQKELLDRLVRALAMVTLVRRQIEQRASAVKPFRAVLAGPPNAGKSSLFNALAGKDAALVSAEPGTTRDYLEATLFTGGIQVALLDTAGLRTSPDALETAAQSLGKEQLDQADVIVSCEEAPMVGNNLEIAQLAAEGKTLRVATKCDLAEAPPGYIATSAVTGLGLDEVRDELARRARARKQPALAPSLSRCRHHVDACLGHLRQAHSVALNEDPAELLALELRGALDELGAMVGAVYTDDLLDRVFSRFCIGK